MTSSSNGGRVLGVIGLCVGLVIGYVAGQQDGPRLNPSERNLDASLWVQTAAEYRACCLQTYRLAWERLSQKLARLPKDGLPPAVVMDLDETVFDNGPYQTWLYEHAKTFDPRTWAIWEAKCGDEVGLVPGAFAFIEQAEKAGVAVVYISNRDEKTRSGTLAALKHLKLATEGIEKRLKLQNNGGDKTARRKWAEQHYRVLMLFGDNLRDFSEEFKGRKVSPDDAAAQNEAIADRQRQVDRQLKRFGDDWIILPNPVYGEWTNLIGSRPARNLRSTKLGGS
jgi:acid phosphatase